MGRPFKCPYCGSVKTHWKGYRKTLKGLKRIRLCRGCNTELRSISDYCRTDILVRSFKGQTKMSDLPPIYRVIFRL